MLLNDIQTPSERKKQMIKLPSSNNSDNYKNIISSNSNKNKNNF